MNIRNKKKQPDAGILRNYNYIEKSQGYDQIEEAFRALLKDNLLQLLIPDLEFRFSNDGNKIGKLCIFPDIRYTISKKVTTSQPITLEFKFSAHADAGVKGHALV